MDNSNPSAEKSSKELREEKSRDLKLEEQVLKTLGPASNIEEKFNLLLRKFIENEKNCKKLNSTMKLNEKKFDTLLREKEHLQKEYNKGVLMKDKLEQVCREQQKLIKSVKNESLSKIKEEEEKRKESQAKFQDSINEISVTLNKNNEENIKLKEDNIEMTKKLKYLAEQYQTREKQLQKISEQINLETQLNEAKLTKLQMEAAIEKEGLLREKQVALDELINCKKVIHEMQNREELLKEQLKVYTSKYDDFQVSLQKSNDIFVSYKVELDKVYKNNKKLEKECVEWKKKWEKSNASLIELATEKQAKDEYIAKITRQLNQLQKLLRALQAERNSLHQVLKDNNIERPPIPVLPAEPEISLQPPTLVQSNYKVDQMVKNCAELKQTLSKLQNQVEAITNKQSTEVESKRGKSSKKSKSKSDTITSAVATSSNNERSTITTSKKNINDWNDIGENQLKELLEEAYSYKDPKNIGKNEKDEVLKQLLQRIEREEEKNSEITTNVEWLSTVSSLTTTEPLQDTINSVISTTTNQQENESTIVTVDNKNNDLNLIQVEQQKDLNNDLKSHAETILDRIENISDDSNQLNPKNIENNACKDNESNAQDNLETTEQKMNETLNPSNLKSTSSTETDQIVTDFNSKCEINE